MTLKRRMANNLCQSKCIGQKIIKISLSPFPEEKNKQRNKKMIRNPGKSGTAMIRRRKGGGGKRFIGKENGVEWVLCGGEEVRKKGKKDERHTQNEALDPKVYKLLIRWTDVVSCFRSLAYMPNEGEENFFIVFSDMIYRVALF